MGNRSFVQGGFSLGYEYSILTASTTINRWKSTASRYASEMVIDRLPLVALGLSMLLNVGHALAMPTSYSDVVVFGDSLSDVGNTARNPLVQFIDFFGAGTTASVVNDRFSNGPLWVERLSEKLGLPGSASSRSDAGGDNYAHGGARTGPGRLSFNVIDNLGRQVSNYTASETPVGSELFVLWGGGNDLFDSANTPAQIRDNMADHVTALASVGAQHFLVMNLPLLGDVPRNRGTSNQTPLNNQAIAYNDLLDSEMALLESALGIEMMLFDVEATFARLLAEPTTFGFTNTTDPAFDVDSETAVPNPEDYVFWDEIHPTGAAHAILGDAVYVALQTPGDFTGDGVVDETDLQRVLTNFGQSTTPFDLEQGDWDGDGQVGINELDLVFANWTQPQAANVPEPASILMLFVLTLLTAGRSSPRRTRCRCGR